MGAILATSMAYQGNVEVLEDHAIECDATFDLSYETGIANRLHKKGSVGRQALSLVLV